MNVDRLLAQQWPQLIQRNGESSLAGPPGRRNFNDLRREFPCLQAGDERREVYPQRIDLHALFSAIKIPVNHLGSTR